MIKYYIQNGNCGTETAFKIIGAKWKPAILYLCNKKGTCTYIDFKQALPRITDAILTKQLKELVKDEMLEKTIVSENNKPFFSITQKTKDLMPAMELMNELADMCNYDSSDYISKIEYTKYLIGNKWKSRIIWTIYNCETIRFNELKNCIEGLSHKILIEHLSSFIANGFVNKIDYNKKNPHVEYSLTSKGKKAYKIIKLMADWCIKYELIKPIITINY